MCPVDLINFVEMLKHFWRIPVEFEFFFFFREIYETRKCLLRPTFVDSFKLISLFLLTIDAGALV